MWLFTRRGFFSIVQHKEKPEYLVVRARVKGDIEKHWPEAEVEEDTGTDYKYRATIMRFEVVHALNKIFGQIDYHDFKAIIEDKERGPWYFNVWETMCDMQESLARRRQ